MLKKFQKLIDYKFKNENLLKQALTHISYSNENKKSGDNERLEFLGDSALDIIVAEELFTRFPELSEGDLTRIRSSLVRNVLLAESARALNIGNYLYLGKGEEQNGGRERDSILADSIESLIGAIFLDGGIEAAKKFWFVSRKARENILKEFQELINYKFKNESLLKQALTHSSYSYETKKGPNNERLEFLGDAALEIIISEELFTRFPELSEGDLTRIRASVVCESSLAERGRALNIGDFLYLGKGEDQTGGRERDSILADAMESLIGAIFIDGGFAAAKKFTLFNCANGIDGRNGQSDYKTLLQERYQKFSKVPLKYELIKESGPAHEKSYTVRLTHNGETLGAGTGRNKKEAQQRAAYEALKKTNKNN